MLKLKKNYALLHSSSDGLYEFTDDDVERMHEVLLSIYDDIYAYCEKHSLKLIAGGGTALGTVRHKGFIPWDDDMDLNLVRADYEEFKKHFDEELGSRYDLLAPGYEKGASCFLMRVLKKDTTLLNMIDENSPYSTGIYIDITPIDYAPNWRATRKIKGYIADMLRFISYSVYWYQYKSRSLEQYMMNSEGKSYYRFRILTGAIFGFRSSEKWFITFDRFIRGKASEFVTVAAGRKKYCGETFPVTVFFPLSKASFEGREIYVYKDVDRYLSSLYGDYMKIPEAEDREHHLCLALDFEKSRGD